MKISLSSASSSLNTSIQLPGSKSESNRVLVIRSLSEQNFEIRNLSEAQDTITLNALITQLPAELNVGPAGTAMRFLAARLALIEGETYLLTGSDRMLQRPIGILVDALRQIGADIDYAGENGFPPLLIKGKKLAGGALVLDGSISSQFITALALIAPQLPEGLVMSFKNELISKPYLLMTLDIMAHFRVKHFWENNQLIIPCQAYLGEDFTVESDWSAASYWYQTIAFAKSGIIRLASLKPISLQGDSAVAKLYENFGVSTHFDGEQAILTKLENFSLPENLAIDCSDFPDIAQTLAVTAAGLGVELLLW